MTRILFPLIALALAGCEPTGNPNTDCAASQATGAIAGGIIGNQVGSGSGRTAATAVGAATGAVIGNNLGC